MIVSMDDPSETLEFPDTSRALVEPNGLLAVGGSLSTHQLLKAYSLGIFPWYEENEPILWWTPNPRMVLYPNKFRATRSLKKTIRNVSHDLRFDTDFRQVITLCQKTHAVKTGTWITTEMIDAYCQLFEQGYAHSVEIWDNRELVAGLYGVALGGVFFGESMFTLKRDFSKVAVYYLCEHLKIWDYELIDCQVQNTHLASLGSETLSRTTFENELKRLVLQAVSNKAWKITSL